MFSFALIFATPGNDGRINEKDGCTFMLKERIWKGSGGGVKVFLFANIWDS